MIGPLYTFVIRLYGWFIHLAAWRSAKAKQWVVGRKGVRWQAEDFKGEWVWFHAASLGEFEQGQPLIEKFRASHPGYRILVTFFSPSGYEHRKDYPHADAVRYLPLDLPSNVAQFLDAVQPKVAVFIKYEFWFNYLKALQQRGIPVLVTPAIFRPEQAFFSWKGAWMRPFLRSITRLQVQDSRSATLLKGIGVAAEVVGDSRVERVLHIVSSAEPISWVENFLGGKSCVVVGSNWKEDDALLAPLVAKHPEWKWIFAPHDVGPDNVARLKAQLPRGTVLLSENQNPESGCPAVVVDRIGLLNKLYRYARVAYVGGGFTDGIHSILEPAAYGVPVVFGPDYKSFAEAVDFVTLGCGISITNGDQLNKTLEHWMQNQAAHAGCQEKLNGWFARNQGAVVRMHQALSAMLG